ncbi:MAG: riboflavin synthase [Thermoleophilia bacterium]|nr:riboflavin synthase [Thermoleophilia bacterium]MDH4340042.1 riboflavin synthase [Thermoleophilia bacterium]MDH5280687.1 riboflavin synthase [Thermoleophilia bacterium]
MFTGIVRELGVVVSTLDRGGDRVLGVRAPSTASKTNVGDSVSINGCCLTAGAVQGDRITFHAVSETLARTTLGRLEADDPVNVEAALRAGEPLGGHYVQGHIDGVGRVQSVEAEGEGLRVFVEASDDVLRYCVEKGSVTVDGISLTIAEVANDAFAAALVPHTLEVTSLSGLVPGREVNIEVDVLAKYVERLLASGGNRGA